MGRLFDLGTIDNEVLRAALEPRVRVALAPWSAAGGPLDSLAIQRELRRTLPAELARGAAELLRLRELARGRWPDAAEWVLTAKGLAQASSAPAAAARARECARIASDAAWLDGTAGIGADSVALADAGLAVVSCDLDFLHARAAAANLERRGHRARVVCADGLSGAVRAPYLALDPDRRAGGGRELDPVRWSPSFPAAVAALAQQRGAVLKLSPVADAEVLDRDLPDGLARRWSWVSAGAELVELCLWTGALADPGRAAREALVLDREGREHRFGASAEDLVPEPHLDPDAAPAFVLEPDPAVVRSHLVGPLARSLGAAPLGPLLGFLGLDAEPPASPFYRSFRVLAQAPADRRRVRALLAEHDIGPVSVRVRGHQRNAAELAREFSGHGSRRGQLLVARLEAGHRVYLVEPWPGPAARAGLP
ncbi:MAG: hypothetical protein GC161_18970 [Planctomycetaceae bacterium]|nr:hypothetical protein [Planctomycetaceae bacterium]